MGTPANTPPTKPTPEQKVQQSPVFLSIVNELNANADQLARRQRLISDIEAALSARFGAHNRLISYIVRFGHPQAIIHAGDLPHWDTLLTSVSGAEQINLVLHSPGGDGSIIEKMVDMCRAHLKGNNRKLRVIVPNVAKSAATVMVLGSDQIVMGYPSELGPIDPQVQILVSGQHQQVSALSFVEARDTLMDDLKKAIKAKEPTVGILTQLAGLNIPFTQEMVHQIDFAKKTAARLLEKYMLKPIYPKQSVRLRKAEGIAEKLLSKQLFPIHGQFIDADTATNKLDLQVETLEMHDELWVKIWEYYVRCEVQMNIPLWPNAPIKIKLFESSQASLVTPAG